MIFFLALKSKFLSKERKELRISPSWGTYAAAGHLLVAKKQAPYFLHIYSALTLVYTFAASVSHPLAWRLNAAQGPPVLCAPDL